MAKPRRSRRILTVVVLVLLSLTIITVDQTGRTHHVTSGIKSVANDVFAPLRSAVDDLLRPVGNVLAGAVHYGALQQENQKLQRTLAQLRQRQAEQPFENQQLQQLLRLQNLPYLAGLPTVTAQTQVTNLSNFVATIGINKGRSQGVEVGDPVVGAGGLIGQVAQAGHSTATIRLITDGQSKVGAVFGPANELTATVNGQGVGDPLAVDFVAPQTPLSRGERLYTNQLMGGEFPAGIPVAFVQSFHTSSGASQISIAAQPLADLENLAYVDVVQWQPSP